MHAMLEMMQLSISTPIFHTSFISKPQTIACSKTVNSANPTITAAPTLENETPAEAILGFELVAAGPLVVSLGFPVVVESAPNAPKKSPTGKTSVVTVAPALQIVSIWPSPIRIVAMSSSAQPGHRDEPARATCFLSSGRMEEGDSGGSDC
jgi:hypothetical protein